MGLWERLIGSSSAQERAPRHLLSELTALYREEVRLAQQLRAHADHAPHHAGSQLLRTAAEEQDRLVGLLRDAMVARGGQENDETGPIKGGKNHWTRVVHDLEDNTALLKRYTEQAIYWDPDLPDVVTVLRTLEHGKNRINAFLRDAALRADPHALD